MQHKLSTVFAAVLLGASSLAAVAQPQPGPGRAPQMPQAPAMMPAPNHAAPAPMVQHAPQGNLPGHVQQRHGAGPDHKWVKGTRVPPQFRAKPYVVSDYHRHGLKKPGRGQQWIQNGGD